MIRGLDHVVILVTDLTQAMRDYETLGFQVLPGGTHRDGATQNALISFADGTYLELLAFQREAPEHRWWRHTAAGEGLIDFALLSGQIEAAVVAASARGLHLDGPIAGGRERPDGVSLEWLSAFPSAPDLPFLCADVTARELRVPHGSACQHPNGATGIGRITVAVSDLETSAGRFAALIGHGPTMEPRQRHFKLGTCQVVLEAPAPDLPDSATLEARLAARGDGIASVILRRDHLVTAPQRLDPQLSHGAWLALA